MYIPKFAVFWSQYKRTLIGLLLVVIVVVLGLVAGLEAKLVAAIAALVGMLTSAFAGLTALLMLVPWVGPLLVKALSLPFLWLMNGAGYFMAIFLAHRGHGRSVVDSRILTVIFLFGLVLGYILGKII